MASGKEIRISIQSALNAAGIEATKQQVATMAGAVKKSLGEMSSANRRHWADIKAAWDMGTGAIRKAWGALSTVLKSAFRFETQTMQFKTLIGNIDEAKAHMADLKALGDTPPFGLEEFAKTSRAMMVMTDGALGYKKSLELIGDAAAATGHPIEEMGQAVGRLYAFIRDGQPLSGAVAQLRNMGVITPEVAQKLQDLQEAGKSNAEIWAEVEAQLGRYKGAMADTEKTGDGLMAALKTRWDNIVRAFGMAWADEAKGGMQTVLDKIKEIESDGTLAAWAAKIGEMVREAVAAVKALHAALHEVGTDLPTDKFDRARGKSDGVLQFFGNAWAGLGATGAWLRGLVVPGENARENYHAYAALHGYGQWADANARELSRYNKARGEWHDDIDIREENEKHIEEVKAEAVKKAATIAEVAEKAAAKRATEEKERLQKSLAEGQKKIDVEVAKKAAEEQEKQDKKTLARRIRDMRRLQAEGSRMASEAQAAQAEAQSKLQQAWGWYRDKGSMAAQLEEEKAEAQAEAQFETDFARLQRKYGRNWRDAEGLSIGDEAVRRVAIAREEADEADRYAEATARASQDCAASLARLEKILEDGGRE